MYPPSLILILLSSNLPLLLPTYRFKRVNAAYEVLGNPLTRREYDLELLSREQELASERGGGGGESGGGGGGSSGSMTQEEKDFLSRVSVTGFVAAYFLFVCCFYLYFF